MAAQPSIDKGYLIHTDQLICFIVVAEELSFGRAAKRMGVSQPNISGQIKRLETEVSARLFDRTTRQVRLTKAGLRLLPLARRVVSQTKQMSIAVRSEDPTDQSEIMVGDDAQIFSDGTARKLLEATAPKLRARLRLRSQPKNGWIAGLVSGNADIAFLNHAPQNQVNVRYEMISHASLVVAVPEQHAYAKLHAVDPELLEGQTVIVPPEQKIGPLRLALRPLLQSESTVIEVVETDQDWVTILETVRCGLGIALVPETVSTVSDGGLVFVPFSTPGPHVVHYLAWREDEKRQDVLDLVESLISAQSVQDT